MRAASLLLGILVLQSLLVGQTPVIQSVVNSGPGDNRYCPGLVVSVFGANFGSSKSAITASVSGKPAPIISFSSSFLLVQIPFEAPPGPSSLSIQVQGKGLAIINLTIDTYAPALNRAPGGFGSVRDGRFLGSDNSPITSDRPAHAGEKLTAVALGLGQTDPPLVTGLPTAFTFPILPSVLAPVSLTVGRQPASVISAVAEFSTIGLYDITFTVPSDLSPGVYPVAATVGGKTSNSVDLQVGSGGIITGIANAANFFPVDYIAPGSMVTVLGSGFGSIDSLGVFPATSASGVSVTFNGIPAPIFDLIGSTGQINVLAPAELSGSGRVQVIVQANGSSTLSREVNLFEVLPAFFRINDPSIPFRWNVTAERLNTSWFVMPRSMARALGLPDSCSGLEPGDPCGQPAQAGDIIQIYTTGLGKATDPDGNPLRTGDVAPSDGSVLFQTVRTPVVTIGGVPAEVLSSIVSPGFAGRYEVTIRVPNAAPPGDDIPILISMQGPEAFTFSDSVTIAINPRK